MLSSKQARRMQAKERRVLRRALRTLGARSSLRGMAIVPGPPTSTSRERGGVIVYEWRSPWGLSVTLRAAPRQSYTLRREQSGTFEAIARAFAALAESMQAAGRALRQPTPTVTGTAEVLIDISSNKPVLAPTPPWDTISPRLRMPQS